jgi:hypothetical protein
MNQTASPRHGDDTGEQSELDRVWHTKSVGDFRSGSQRVGPGVTAGRCQWLALVFDR